MQVAIDTSTDTASLALVQDDEVLGAPAERDDQQRYKENAPLPEHTEEGQENDDEYRRTLVVDNLQILDDFPYYIIHARYSLWNGVSVHPFPVYVISFSICNCAYNCNDIVRAERVRGGNGSRCRARVPHPQGIRRVYSDTRSDAASARAVPRD